MAQRFQHLHRRRRITIVTANTPNGSPGAAAAARSRVTVATRYPKPRPNYRNLTRVVVTPRVTGVIQPPVPGAGGAPKPLQPTWTIGTMRRKTSKNVYRPIVVQQRFVPPAKDGYSSQIVVPAPRRPRRTPAPSVSHAVFDPRTIQPPRIVVAPRFQRGKRLRGLALVLPGDAFEVPSPTTIQPTVVPRLPRRRGVHAIVSATAFDPDYKQPDRPATTVIAPRAGRRLVASAILLETLYDSTRQLTPFAAPPLVVPRHAPRRRLRGLALILPADAFEMPSPTTMRSIVVPSRLKGNKALRRAIIVAAKGNENPGLLTPPKTLVVPYRKVPRQAPWTISTLYRKFVPPPPEHYPLPHVSVVPAPRRAPSLRPRPIASKSAYQFPGNMVDKPWDLIAACIAWLRQDPKIVAAFGDVQGSTNRQKFVSDVELPKTNPPYAVFDEPWEVENYESPDNIGLRASVAHGRFEINVYTTEKLAARRLADDIANSLNDAPLIFTDGVLIYLRRADREWRTFTSPGNGPNVTLYRRTIGFDYHIDRYF